MHASQYFNCGPGPGKGMAREKPDLYARLREMGSPSILERPDRPDAPKVLMLHGLPVFVDGEPFSPVSDLSHMWSRRLSRLGFGPAGLARSEEIRVTRQFNIADATRLASLNLWAARYTLLPARRITAAPWVLRMALVTPDESCRLIGSAAVQPPR